MAAAASPEYHAMISLSFVSEVTTFCFSQSFFIAFILSLYSAAASNIRFSDAYAIFSLSDSIRSSVFPEINERAESISSAYFSFETFPSHIATHPI